MAKFKGTKHNDSLNGTSGADIFDLSQGGNDTANGGAGNDKFVFKAAFTARDHVDGGSGSDTVSLNGTYAKKIVLAADTITGVEKIMLTGSDYSLATNDANVGHNKTLTIDASSAIDLRFNGHKESDGHFHIIGAADTTIATGGAKSDVFDYSHAATSSLANGGGGDDVFDLGATFGSGDSINGGAGHDTLKLDGDYSSGVIFGNANGDTLGLNHKTMTGVETMLLAAGHSYKFTSAEETVAAGATLTVDGHALGAGETLTFDGHNETDGFFHLKGGAGDDTFTVGGSNVLDASTVNGGGGSNTLVLDGDYSSFTLGMVSNIQTLKADDGHSYLLYSTDDNVASGHTMTIDASAVSSGHSLQFDGAVESNGSFNFIGGGGIMNFDGGANADTVNVTGSSEALITAGQGADDITVGSENDLFFLSTATDSVSTTYDTIHGFDASNDTFHVGFAVSGVSSTSADVNANTFDADIGAACGGDSLGSNGARLIAATGGLNGHTFLVVDANGNSSYDAGTDYVFDVTGSTGSFTTSTFVHT